MRFRLFAAVLIAACAGLACHDTCPYNTEPKAYITFYVPDNNGIPQASQKEFDSVYGLGSSRLISLSSDKECSYILPVPLNQDSAKFVFVAYDGTHDTLALRYARDFEYVSRRCGLAAKMRNVRLNRDATTFANIALRDSATTERSSLTQQRIGVWIDIQ